jgi:hypothetical protein
MTNPVTSFRSLSCVAALFCLAITKAEEPHKHDHRLQAGPNKGRLLTIVEPHAEFLVTKEGKIEIRFVSDDMNVLPPGKQVVRIIMGDRSAPTTLSFQADGDKLVSDKEIPAGNMIPTVVQIKVDEDAGLATAKFNLNLDLCPECKNAEYACICDHSHD